MRVSNNTEWLFFHLWKKNPETMLPCLNLYLAETIIFRWAQPYFWYSTAKDGMIVRRTKEKILLQNIEDSYTMNVPKCDVIATTLTSSEDPILKAQEKIEFEYIQKNEFHDYLFQKEKSHNVIIQKFIEPKNGQNALIKVAWTPQFCLFFRKTNIHEINNSKVPLVNRLATFEGGEHLSNSDSISSPILASELEQTCLNIVKHVHSVTSGNVQISKMVLYFKLDDKNRLWLLFCTGLKLREKMQLPGQGLSSTGFKKKNERPLSPIMTVALKRDKEVQKPKIPLQYLLEDQINQVDDTCCLRCNKEDLLYDLKLKLILEHEEKILRGVRPKDIEYTEEPDHDESAPFFGGLLAPTTGKKNIPHIMKKLYPNLTEERYLKLKKNISLMNMAVKLCESCYLIITENLLENAEEKNAKKFQAQMKEFAKKDPDSMPFSGLSKKQLSVPPTSATGAEKTHKMIRGLLEKEGIGITGTPSEVDSMASRRNKNEFVGSRTEDNFFGSGGKHSSSKSSAGLMSGGLPDTRHQHVKSAFQVKREVLPEIAVTHADFYKPEQTLEAEVMKGYFTREVHPVEIKRFIPEQPVIKQMRSPYSSEIRIRNHPTKENFEERTPGYATAKQIRFLTAQSKERLPAQPPVNTKKDTSQFSKSRKYQRTNYSSMMDTIKDLRAYLGSDIGDL